MEAVCSSETSVDFERNTLLYIPEDSTFHNHRCKNLMPYIQAAYFQFNVKYVNAISLNVSLQYKANTQKVSV
jgi:hypothetical protein